MFTSHHNPRKGHQLTISTGRQKITIDNKKNQKGIKILQIRTHIVFLAVLYA